jgi:hypothetical protein
VLRLASRPSQPEATVRENTKDGLMHQTVLVPAKETFWKLHHGSRKGEKKKGSVKAEIATHLFPSSPEPCPPDPVCL